MARAAKTLSGAYGSALLGILLGIVGLHRFYLRRYISATLIDAAVSDGIVYLSVPNSFCPYYSLLGSLSTALTDISAGGNFSNIPTIPTTGPLNAKQAPYGILACGTGCCLVAC